MSTHFYRQHVKVCPTMPGTQWKLILLLSMLHPLILVLFLIELKWFRDTSSTTGKWLRSQSTLKHSYALLHNYCQYCRIKPDWWKLSWSTGESSSIFMSNQLWLLCEVAQVCYSSWRLICKRAKLDLTAKQLFRLHNKTRENNVILVCEDLLFTTTKYCTSIPTMRAHTAISILQMAMLVCSVANYQLHGP